MALKTQQEKVEFIKQWWIEVRDARGRKDGAAALKLLERLSVSGAMLSFGTAPVSATSTAPAAARPSREGGKWIDAKYDGVCVGCDKQINKGDLIFYNGETHCGDCGPE